MLFTVAITIIACLATSALAKERCFDGKYFMDPNLMVRYESATCPHGYRIAALPNLDEHVRAASLVYECKGAGESGWIGSTNEGATYGGELALVAPKAGESIGGVVKAVNGNMAVICERI